MPTLRQTWDELNRRPSMKRFILGIHEIEDLRLDADGVYRTAPRTEHNYTAEEYVLAYEEIVRTIREMQQKAELELFYGDGARFYHSMR